MRLIKISLGLVILLAVLGVGIFSFSTFFTTTSIKVSPTTLNEIRLKGFLQTAETTGQTIVEYRKSIAGLKLTQRTVFFQVTLQMNSGIDLNKLKDSDFKVEGTTLYVTLPPIELSEGKSDFKYVGEDKELIAFFTRLPKTVAEEIVAEGKSKIRDEIISEGRLAQQGAANAEVQLRNLILQATSSQFQQIIFRKAPISSQPTLNSLPK